MKTPTLPTLPDYSHILTLNPYSLNFNRFKLLISFNIWHTFLSVNRQHKIPIFIPNFLPENFSYLLPKISLK